MAIPESFADAPQSIAEIRAEKAGDGSLWSPRDALVELLREIDAGRITPDALVIVYSKEVEQGSAWVSWSVACKDPRITLGLLNRAAHRINAYLD